MPAFVLSVIISYMRRWSVWTILCQVCVCKREKERKKTQEVDSCCTTSNGSLRMIIRKEILCVENRSTGDCVAMVMFVCPVHVCMYVFWTLDLGPWTPNLEYRNPADAGTEHPSSIDAEEKPQSAVCCAVCCLWL